MIFSFLSVVLLIGNYLAGALISLLLLIYLVYVLLKPDDF
jgi:K+-transporting ATPase KdpF subunit